ncbi:MAG: histidine phosphatase family protein [Actinomycetota bacterium]|nr:histidine phosphatase family protein [Actinomycetota bacterium]
MTSEGRQGTVTLLRHAETEWSLSGRHTGHTDLPLTDGGREKARALAPRLRERSFDRVLASPLSRASETARLAGFPGAEHDRDLMEWDYGEDEGLTTAQIREQRGSGWLLWRDGAAGGEVADDVGARVDRVVERITADDGDVLIFAHGHVLRVLAARWLQQPADFGARLVLGTGTLSVLGYEHDIRALLSWNAG